MGLGAWQRGRGWAHPGQDWSTHAAHSLHNPPRQGPSLLPALLPLPSLAFLSSHLKEQMGARGEGGQSWEQEREALPGLLSHLRSQQERAESPSAPQPPDPALMRAPCRAFISFSLEPTVPVVLLGHSSLPVTPSKRPSSCCSKECSAFWDTWGRSPDSLSLALFPGVADRSTKRGPSIPQDIIQP